MNCPHCGEELSIEAIQELIQGLQDLPKTGMKVCSMCGEEKLADLEFYAGRSECRYCSIRRYHESYVVCDTCGLHRKKGSLCSRGCGTRVRRQRLLKCGSCRRSEKETKFFSARICLDCLGLREQQQMARRKKLVDKLVGL